MKINQIAQSVQTQQVSRKGKKTEAAPVKPGSDKVEISSEARNLAKNGDVSAVAKSALNNASEVRSDKIAEIREKIDQGFYRQENVGAEIADKLLKEFGI